jgi:hypothetical protein
MLNGGAGLSLDAGKSPISCCIGFGFALKQVTQFRTVCFTRFLPEIGQNLFLI